MAEPIRILNLFTIMNRGGAETMVMNYYRSIDRTKVQFDFMVHRQERGAYDDEIETLGGRIFRMPPVRPWTANAYRKTIRKFYREHPEYKVIHSHMSELGYYDFLEAERAGVPVRICHAHNRPYGIDLKSPIRWYYKTRMMPHITHMFMCGQESGDWLFGKKNRKRFIQMNNAINAEAYAFDEARRAKVRASLGLKNEFVIGHVGRFDLQKNHTFMIDIFEAVHRLEPNSRLLLVGNDSGKLAEEIHRKVQELGLEEAVHFLGVRSDVADLMQAMDVFLFPSLFEGLSVASVEAQASGLPTIISDGIPIECKITDLVEVMPLSEHAEIWAKKLLELGKNQRENTFEQIKAAGFDINENAKKLQQFYIKAANGETEWH